MPIRKPPTPRVPPLRRHKVKGRHDRAYVNLNGQRRYLGRWGSVDAKRAYELLVADFLTHGGELPARSIGPAGDTPGPTVAELVAAFWRHAKAHYRKPDGTPTSTLHTYRLALRPLRRLHAATPAHAFGPRDLKAVRSAMVRHGYTRGVVNQAVNLIRGVFRWGVENELISPVTYQALQAVRALQAGRTDAPEGRRVLPVPEPHVEAVRPHVPRQVAALIDLQLCTGARAGELVNLRAVDLDTAGEVWTADVTEHKGAWRGKSRTIYIGPRAQGVISPFLVDRPIDRPLFSPIEAEGERRERMHEARVTPVEHGNRPGTNRKRKPARPPGEAYTTASYRRCIERACVKAGVPVWTPHRLRHNAATLIRREHGLEAAQLMLGHASATLTDAVYAERDEGKVRRVAALVG